MTVGILKKQTYSDVTQHVHLWLDECYNFNNYNTTASPCRINPCCIVFPTDTR